mgnify:FL=1
MKLPVRDDILSACVVMLVVILLAFVSKTTQKRRHSTTEIVRASKELILQAQTWSKMSQQDQAMLFKLQHTVLALSYLNAARLLCNDDDILRHTNVNVHTTIRELETAQRKLMKKMTKQCTSTNPSANVPAVTWL